MPLTEFQRTLLAVLAESPNDDRYLAGGAAMHFSPDSARYSDDLDFFHDSEARVASAFAQDRGNLERAGYGVDVELSLPGFVRARVSRAGEATRVDWAHDSAWRFMPLVRDELGCLYYATADERFVVPRAGETLVAQGIVPHYGSPGGVLPRIADTRLDDFDAGPG